MRHFIILASLLLIVSNASAQPIRYPLHVGNVWQYEYGVTWYIDKDTVMQNSKTYAIVMHDYPNYPYHQVSFERQEGSQVFRYFTDRDTEYVWYDFSASIGVLINTIPMDADTAEIRFGGCSGAEIFGHFWPLCLFEIDYRPIKTDDDEGYAIADDIGVYYVWFGPWVYYTLIGARVDGIIYGSFTDINNYNDSYPSSIKLFQNYPNPFNPLTTISYTVYKSAQVKIHVYDILGREVAILIDERKQPGEYSVTWNAVGIPTGVYFYRIVAGEFTQTKKMVVIR